MRVRLVVNPHSTSANPLIQEEAIARLSRVFELSVEQTQSRNDGVRIARAASDDSIDALVGLGGDGTINELANGLMCVDLSKRPILGAIPAGNANVFARAMGYSKDSLAAADQLIEAIQADRVTTLGIGSVEWRNGSNDAQQRWFMFNAGLGIDARVIASMDALRANGKRVNDFQYARLALRELMSHAHASMHAYDQDNFDLGNLEWTVVTNLSPWTFVGSRGLTPTPNSGPNTELDFFGVRELNLARIPGVIRALASNIATETSNLVIREDQPKFTVDSISPVQLQVDGEALGPATWAQFTYQPDALRAIG